MAAALAIAGAAAAFIAVVAAATRARDIAFFAVAGDPVIVTDAPLYAGSLSNAGVLVWWAGASACAVMGALLLRAGAPDSARAVLLLGAVTALLALDDLFLVHEEVGPYVGVPQNAIIAAHALAVGAVLVAARRAVPAVAWPMLAVALVAFAVSIGWDVLRGDPANLDRVIEDGAKFVGIACWTAFVVQVGWTNLRPWIGAAGGPSRRAV